MRDHNLLRVSLLSFRIKNNIGRKYGIRVGDEYSLPVVYLGDMVNKRPPPYTNGYSQGHLCDAFSGLKSRRHRKRSSHDTAMLYTTWHGCLQAQDCGKSIFRYRISIINSFAELCLRGIKTHLPAFCGTPNAKALKDDFTALQIPQAWKLHRTAFPTPRSHMHCEEWNVRNSLTPGPDAPSFLLDCTDASAL